MNWRKIKLSKEQVTELTKAEKSIKNARLLKRIQCIKLKDKSWKHREIQLFLNIQLETISKWIKSYTEGGITELLSWNYEGRSSALTTEDKIKLIKRNQKKPFETAKEAQDYIKKEFCLDWHLHWVQKLLKKNFNFHSKK